MIKKTIGSGVDDDYANLGEAWDAVSLPDGATTWTDHYDFLITSNFTEPNKVFVSAPFYNGFTLTIRNPNNYVITMDGWTLYNFPGRGFVVSGSGVIIDNLIIQLPATVGSTRVFNIRHDWVDQNFPVTYKNVLILGGGNKGIIGIDLFGVGPSEIKVFNCRCYNIGIGIRTGSYGNGVTTNKYIENCTTYQCGIGVLFGNNANNGAIIKNVCCINSGTEDFATESDASTTTITNCADSDNSIASSGAVLSGNITGITDFDFLSVDPASADFLKIGKKREYYSELAGWWKGEESGDDAVAGNTALVENISYAQGYTGKCFSFARVNNFIGILASPELYGFMWQNQFTIEFWTYQSFDTDYITMFGRHRYGGRWDGYWDGFAILFYMDGRARIGSNGNFPSQHYAAGTVPYGEFCKISLKFNGINKWELYVNDVLKTPTTAYASLPWLAVTEPQCILKFSHYLYNSSLFDEIKIINDGLIRPSQSDSALYKTGTADISAWNTADAFGKPRPDYRGAVSIGVHEPISANATLRVKIGASYYTKTKAVTY